MYTKRVKKIPLYVCGLLLLSIPTCQMAFSQLSTNLSNLDSTLLHQKPVNSIPKPSHTQQQIIDTSIIIPVLDFSDMRLQDALTALIRAYQLSVYIDSSVTGSISMRLENVSLNDAFLFIIMEYNLNWERIGGIVKIFKPEIIPPPLPSLDISYENGLISFNLKDADLRRFVSAVIDMTGKNIIIDEGASGIVTGRLINLDFEKGMKSLLNSNGFSFGNIDDIYHIGYIDKSGADGRSVSRYSISCKRDKVSLNVRNAPIDKILTTLSDECGMGIVLHGKIEGSITASYKEKPLIQVLNLLLRGTPYSYKKEGDIYFVGSKELESMYISKLVKLKHISYINIEGILPARLAKQVSHKPVKEQNGLILTGPATSIFEIEEFINKLDIPPAQVLFDAIVVDYSVSEFKQFDLTMNNTGERETMPGQSYFPSIDYSATGNRLNDDLDNITDFFNITNVGHLSSDFFLQLKFMEEEGIANIISRPQIAALNGHPASINIGTSQYYLLESQTIYPSQQSNVSTQTSQRFEVIKAEMSLEVIPWVTESGDIIVEIQPEFNNPATAFNPDIPPTINHRILKSTIRLKDGETIILGGMIQNQENTTIQKFPILGNLPIIGRLFQNRKTTKSKSELMVYLTPHVYYGSEGSVDIENILKEK